MINSGRAVGGVLAVWACLLLAQPALAIFHTYRIVEMYSSVDGSVQYIKLQEQFGAGNQHIWAGVTLTCEDANDPGIVNTLTFPSNLPSASTAGRFVLVATANFSSLPGGITPDYVIPPNFLFVGGGTLNFGGVQILNYGSLPTDGLNARTAGGMTIVNAPRNFAGATGSVNVPAGVCCNDSACSISTQGGCSGTWTLGGSCSPDPCVAPSGVCCAGATCAVTTSTSCTGPNTMFLVGGAVCNAGSNAVTPCCFANYDRMGGITVGDIFEFLNEWFSSSIRADMVGNGSGTPTVDSIFSFLNAWFAGGC